MPSDRLLARATAALPDVLVRASGRVQTWAYRASGSRIGGRFAGEPVLLLTTTGRKSGQPRTTVLLYGTDGERLVVIGSNTGSERAPAWALNLSAHPEATVVVGRTSRAVRAVEVEGVERERLWALMNDLYGGFDSYRARTQRHIKVFALAPG